MSEGELDAATGMRAMLARLTGTDEDYTAQQLDALAAFAAAGGPPVVAYSRRPYAAWKRQQYELLAATTPVSAEQASLMRASLPGVLDEASAALVDSISQRLQRDLYGLPTTTELLARAEQGRQRDTSLDGVRAVAARYLPEETR